MTDFINFGKTKRVAITESTKKVIESELKEDLDIETLTEEEIVKKVNSTKKGVAKRTKKGVVIKQSLNG